MHILSSEQLKPAYMKQLFYEADAMRANIDTDEGRRELAQRHMGLEVVSLFYEASTRTRFSFERAALKLGMQVIGTEDAEKFSSVSKGESIEDTVRICSAGKGAAAIILRSKEEGQAELAAASSLVPLMNAGDGKNEHPTQGALDLYTVMKAKGRLDNLNFVLGGDMRQGRTARTLSKLISNYPRNHITFVSTPEFTMNQDVLDYISQRGTTYTETTDMYESLPEADVVYWTRLQKERLNDDEQQQNVESQYVLGEEALKCMNTEAVIMHPLPRVNEIDKKSVDADPRAIFFDQAENGLYIRMALLDRAAKLVKSRD